MLLSFVANGMWGSHLIGYLSGGAVDECNSASKHQGGYPEAPRLTTTDVSNPEPIATTQNSHKGKNRKKCIEKMA